MKRINIILIVLSLVLLGCKGSINGAKLYQMPAKTEHGFNMIVEIPAGTNHKIEFNTENKKFEVDQIDGQDRIIDFLPYPGNYGFIPSTLMDEERGGDGDALDVLLISESLPTGTMVEIKPIATLLLKDGGEIDTKIIAVPVAPEQQIMEIDHFQEFLIQYDVAKRMIENWFLNYKGFGEMELLGWEDEHYAIKEIEKWMLK